MQLSPAQVAAAQCSLSVAPRTPEFVALFTPDELYFPHQPSVSATLTTPSSTTFANLSKAQATLSAQLGAFYFQSQS